METTLKKWYYRGWSIEAITRKKWRKLGWRWWIPYSDQTTGNIGWHDQDDCVKATTKNDAQQAIDSLEDMDTRRKGG